MQQIIQQQANKQKTFAEAHNGQMTQIMAMSNKLQPTPTHTTPVQHAPQEPMAPREPEIADQMQRGAEERKEQEERGQRRRDKEK